MSDWKQGAAKRRDDRNTKSPEIAKPVRGKKDRKRWCRGKVGVEHKPKCVPYVETKKYDAWRGDQASSYLDKWRILVCTECGKELAAHMPFRVTPDRPVPTWVT
jgi:hypothetical protein